VAVDTEGGGGQGADIGGGTATPIATSAVSRRSSLRALPGSRFRAKLRASLPGRFRARYRTSFPASLRASARFRTSLPAHASLRANARFRARFRAFLCSGTSSALKRSRLHKKRVEG